MRMIASRTSARSSARQREQLAEGAALGGQSSAS
jgi:hypothetical protein